jgi:biotin transport system substrate-specific component
MLNMTFKDTVGADRASPGLLRSAVLILVGTGLLALSAHVQVPFWPVKLSMQSFVVLAIGFAYGSRLGTLTILAYIAEGAAGLPVFQSGAGIPYLAGPTGGYLLGFVLAAAILGYLSERLRLSSITAAAGAVLLSVIAIYVPGVAWLAVLFGTESALPYGLYPFLTGETLKMTLAIAIVHLIRR